MEQPLIPFGSCNLSSINVAKFCSNKTFDFQGLYDTAKKITILMDNVIDNMSFPDPRFKENSLKYRQIGMGMMGLADAMYEMEYKYDSPTGRKFAGEVMACISTAAVEASAELANERGKFSDYDVFKQDVEEIVSSLITEESETRTRVLGKVKKYGLRNSQRITVAPTGTTSLSADASYGMEPCMGLAFQKNVMDGTKMIVVNPVFERKCKGQEWYTDDLVEKILANGGSLKGLRGIPKEVREIFVVAHDIKPKQRIEVQAEIQKFCDSAISSCIVEDTLVDTDKGLLFMDEIDDFDKVDVGKFQLCSFDGNALNHNMERVKIDEIYNNGIKPVFELELENKLTIKCTGNEKFKVLNEENGEVEWKELSIIQEGDRILIK